MKNQLLIVVLLGFIFSSCEENTERSEETNDQAPTVELSAEGKLRYIELSGTPYEIGFSHGSLLKNEIKAVTDSLKIDIEHTTQMNADAFISKFLKETDFLTSMKKWTPELLNEIKGISDGSGIDYNTILMHQLGDEFFFNTEYIMAHKCSSIGVDKTENHPTIAAQNMDIPKYFHGYQTVMKIVEKESGIEKMILTIPGHIGITGLNSKGVSINCNILMQLDNSKKGLPVSGIVRGVLNQTSLNEAVEFLNTVNHASGQNYIIGGIEGAKSFECSANKIEEFKPFENSHFTYHTNHPMVNTNYSERYLEILEEHDVTLDEALNICQRIPSFTSRFNEQTTDFGVTEIKEILSSRDHDGTDVVSNALTYASVIYILKKSPEFHIAPGKPHETDYVELQFGN